MADSDDAIGGLFTVFLALAAVAVVLFLVYVVLNVAIGAGALYGAAVSLRNYGRAFVNNVKPERVIP